MKQYLHSNWIRFCGWVLSLFGIGVGATDCAKMYGCPQPDMYGTPYYACSVKGRVCDSDGRPVKGISVSRYWMSVRTGSEGEFAINASYGGELKDTLVLNVRDIDGSDNGSYESRTKTVQLSRLGDGDDAWNMGIYGAEDVEVTLTATDEK